MKKTLKWSAFFLTGLFGIAALVAVYIYVMSEREIDKVYDIPLVAYAAPSGAKSIERGERLASLVGCTNGCHGKNMEGAVSFDAPRVARINAPNLTKVMREYSDPELLRLLRHGVKLDGTTAWIMPSQMFSHISDEDLGDIIAYLRRAPEREGLMRETTMRPLGRVAIVTGKFVPIVQQVNHSQVAAAKTDTSDPLRYGKYLVTTTCTECHGQDLNGNDFLKAPNLTIAQAYSEEDFFSLMRTGVGIGNRKLGMMTEVSERRFSAFTDDEVRAIRVYLAAYAKAAGAKRDVKAAATGAPATRM